jgi:DNA-binding SARP family transcriptional activator
MVDLVLRLFGPPRIERDGIVVHVGRRKAIAMLVYLALTGRPRSRDLLAGLLWPDLDQFQARSMVRSALRTLNLSAGKRLFVLFEDQVAFPRQPGLWIDVVHFRNLLAAVEAHRHAPAEYCAACVDNLTEATNLAQDAFLEGFSLADAPDFELWQTAESAVLTREMSGALERLVLMHTQNGRTHLAAAVKYAQQWLRLDPLHEPPHRALMRLYAWQGDRAAALYQYEDCRRRLDAELRVTPSAETVKLFAEIREGQPLEPYEHLDRLSGQMVH